MLSTTINPDVSIQFDNNRELTNNSLWTCKVESKNILINKDTWNLLANTDSAQKLLLFYLLGRCDLQRSLLNHTGDECPSSIIISLSNRDELQSMLTCYLANTTHYHEELFRLDDGECADNPPWYCKGGEKQNMQETSTGQAWQCVGGGTTASCSENAINGACATDPAYYCKNGIIKQNLQLTDEGQTWNCPGAYGGTTMSCSRQQECGVCGTPSGDPHSNQSAACNSGTYHNHPDTNTHYHWTCRNKPYTFSTRCNDGSDDDHQEVQCSKLKSTTTPSTTTITTPSTTTTPTVICNTRDGHFGLKNGRCLPSCGHYKNLNNNADVSGRYCRAGGGYKAGQQVESYQTCCTRGECYTSGGHFGLKNGRCLPSCGHYKNLNNNADVSGRYCRAGGGYKAGQQVESYQTCCTRGECYTSGGHFGPKNGRCLPSCGHYKNLNNNADVSGRYCRAGGGYKAGQQVESYQTCCTRGECYTSGGHFGPKNGRCLPSCGHYKNLNNNADVSGRYCRAGGGYQAGQQVESYQTCCTRGECYTSGGHFGPKNGRCLPSCGHYKNLNNNADVSGRYCRAGGGYKAGQQVESYQTCCTRGERIGANPISITTSTIVTMPCNTSGGHFGLKNGRCLPSCGHAVSLARRTGTVPSNAQASSGYANCHSSSNKRIYDIKILEAHDQRYCCARTRK